MVKSTECKMDDLQIAVKAKRTPRFKAGADLSKNVNRIEVSIDQEAWEESETISFEVKIINEVCKEVCN